MGLGRSVPFFSVGQSDHGAIWVWDSMNTGSRLPDGAGGAQRCPEERGEMAGV